MRQLGRAVRTCALRCNAVEIGIHSRAVLLRRVLKGARPRVSSGLSGTENRNIPRTHAVAYFSTFAIPSSPDEI
jgi:hypothetical protein